jgi:hypothetical protein
MLTASRSGPAGTKAASLGGDVFENDLELRRLAEQADQHPLDEGAFPRKDIDLGVHHLAVRRERSLESPQR